MLRRKIFIGEADDRAVYFDTKTQEPLIADKSVLLDTEKAGKTNRFIPSLIGISLLLSLLTSFFGIKDILNGNYSPSMIPFFLVSISIVFIAFIWLMELALYPHVNQTEPASQAEFHEAIYTNLFWRNFNTAKVTIWKYLLFLFVISVLIPTAIIGTVAGTQGVILSFLNKDPFDIQIIFSFGIALLPAVVVLLLFQNNPIRWLNVVRKYQKGEIVFQKVNDEKVEGEKEDDK